MAGMTRNELTEHIKSVVAPLISDTVGRDVAELVRENVARELEKAPKPTNYAAQLFGAPAPTPEPPAEKGIKWARYVRALAGARGDKERAVKVARTWGYDDVAKAIEASIEKAMSAGDPTAGGFLVPTEFSNDIIELLRASSTVRSLNPTTMPMPTGTVKVPKVTGGSTASYIGENTNISKSELETGQITLSFKKLAALVPISNDLVRYSSPSADAIVRDDCVGALAAKEDLAFLRYDGLAGKPKGLKHWINATNKFNGASTVNLANVTSDLGKCLRLIMDADINLVINQAGTGAVGVRPGWIFAPRTWQYLFTVQTSLGTHAFRDEMLRGTLLGFPFRVTTAIPITCTAAADTGGSYSEIYFGAFAHAVIGEAQGVIVDASSEAAYHDGTNVIAAYSQDQTVIRVIAEHDFALRYDKAFSLVQQVSYGA